MRPCGRITWRDLGRVTAMARTVAIKRLPEAGRAAPVVLTPTGSLALAAAAMGELLDSLYANGPITEWSAQDVAILQAVHEAVHAAHQGFAALLAGHKRDVLLETARLQVAARHLSEAALGL